MTKVVINRCFGGFSLSEAAYQELGMEWDGYGFAYDLPRDDQRLVVVVEKLGPAASGTHADLAVVEIPADVDWEIDEYDGKEQVAERHQTWS